MAGLVIDASVAVKWFIAEERGQDAQRVLGEDADLIAPSSVLFEIFHALWDAARTGRIPSQKLPELAEAVPTPFMAMVPIENPYAPAAAIARSHRLAIYIYRAGTTRAHRTGHGRRTYVCCGA